MADYSFQYNGICRSLGGKNIEVTRITDEQYLFKGKLQLIYDNKENTIFIDGTTKPFRCSSFSEIIAICNGIFGHTAKIKRNNSPIKNSTKIRHKLYAENNICVICKKTMIDINDTTLDHIIPRSMGGSNKLTNLRLVHKACNLRRDCRLGKYI